MAAWITLEALTCLSKLIICNLGRRLSKQNADYILLTFTSIQKFVTKVEGKNMVLVFNFSFQNLSRGRGT
jgi:hypothetical protein